MFSTTLIPLRQRTAYRALADHYAKLQDTHLRELFDQDPGRGTALTLEAEGIYLDYSKHRVTAETIDLLHQLAQESDLAGLRAAMFGGEHINITEDRAVLHVALRAPADAVIITDGENVVPDVHEVLGRMRPSPTGCARGSGPGTPASGSSTSSTSASAAAIWPGDGVRGAAALQPARPHLPVRLERGRHRLRREDP